jgi:hypothetical protein
MDFVDRMLVKLSDPATQAGVFDAVALEQIAAAAYDTSQATLDGPYRAVFEEVRLGLSVQRRGNAEGYFGPLGMAERSGANFVISGLGGDAFLIDALWKGCVVASATAPQSHIARAQSGSVDLAAIDTAIATAHGGLPADRTVLATERRTRFEAAIKAAVAHPSAVTADLVNGEITSSGATDINDYFERFGRMRAYMPVQIQYSAAAVPPPAPRSLPISAALVIRSAIGGLTQLLADCRMAREQLIAAGEGRAADDVIPQRYPVIVIWMLPSATFNDGDWPGADVAARRKAAGAWLAREGVGLAVAD